MSTARTSRWHRIRQAIVIRVPRQCVVYALLDPREPKHIRYIGHAFDTRQRLQQHIRDGATATNQSTHKSRWIAALLAEQVFPHLFVLEHGVIPEQALNREDYWIKRSLRIGQDLTNA